MMTHSRNSIAWTIAGSDSCSGAGIQADLQTFQQLGVHGCSVITAITAQNTSVIHDIQYVSPAFIQQQIMALNAEFVPAAVKIGMLGNSEIIHTVKLFLENYNTGHVILDPLIQASSGKHLFDTEQKNYLEKLIQLFPRVDVLTPNIMETEIILNKKIKTVADIECAAAAFLSLGVKNVVIKGGHFDFSLQQQWSQDYWTNGKECCWLASPRYPQKNYRGTGCVFSSALAASIARGFAIKEALVIAKMVVNQGLRLAKNITENTAMLAHEHWPAEMADLPWATTRPLLQRPARFSMSDSTSPSLGIYPVVASSIEIENLLAQGVTTIQLRIKNKSNNFIEDEIKKSVDIARRYQARLFINDYWQLAMKHHAYGVHLGQEDLHTADIQKIHDAGLRLGMSTHNYYEVARAHAYQPSYIACGPIFATTSKPMCDAPQGLAQLHYWRRLLKDYSLVAIGGIHAGNIAEVWATGVNGVAMMSGIKEFYTV